MLGKQKHPPFGHGRVAACFVASQIFIHSLKALQWITVFRSRIGQSRDQTRTSRRTAAARLAGGSAPARALSHRFRLRAYPDFISSQSKRVHNDPAARARAEHGVVGHWGHVVAHFAYRGSCRAARRTDDRGPAGVALLGRRLSVSAAGRDLLLFFARTPRIRACLFTSLRGSQPPWQGFGGRWPRIQAVDRSSGRSWGWVHGRWAPDGSGRCARRRQQRPICRSFLLPLLAAHNNIRSV